MIVKEYLTHLLITSSRWLSVQLSLIFSFKITLSVKITVFGLKKLVEDAVISKVLLIKTKTSSINKNKLNLTVFQSPTQTFTINVLIKQLEIISLYILELNFVYVHILLTHTLFYLHSLGRNFQLLKFCKVFLLQSTLEIVRSDQFFYYLIW